MVLDRIWRKLRGITRIRVIHHIQGQWHDDTWYRTGQVFNCRPTKPPYAPGWRPINLEHSGSIAAEDAKIMP